jgi:hypothetical protein
MLRFTSETLAMEDLSKGNLAGYDLNSRLSKKLGSLAII